MEKLDFLPEKIHLQRKRKTRLIRQSYLVMIFIAGLACFGYVRQGSIRSVRAETEILSGRSEEMQKQLSLLTDLEQQQAELSVIKQIDDRLGSRVCPLDVLSELNAILPKNMGLSSLKIETIEMRVPVDSKSGKSARVTMANDDQKEVVVKRMRLILTGLAPGDVDIANFIGQLSANPLFEDVNMGYAKTVEFQNRIGREFQASCYVVR